MKSRICTNILFLITLFSSLLFSQYPQMDFPLQIGNRWQYTDGSSSLNYSESRAVKDTMMPNGIIYTRVEGSLVSGFFRKEGPKVFSYNTTSNAEFIKYDFSLKAGDTVRVQIFAARKILTTVSSTGTMNVFGYTRNYMTFFQDDLSSTNDNFEMIADGFGILENIGEGPTFGLNGAIINGIQYGEILQVENRAVNIPIHFSLLQNYPNPFNPTTDINYSIPKSGFVKIKVYDLLGREVTTLVNEFKPAGNYHVQFNAGKLVSGVYFYRMESGEYSQTKKLLLLK